MCTVSFITTVEHGVVAKTCSACRVQETGKPADTPVGSFQLDVYIRLMLLHTLHRLLLQCFQLPV
jgi:hypothetical protein